MDLKTAMRLGDSPCLALVGAGGKTSILFRLATEFSPPVIVTSSTHLSRDQVSPRESWFFDKHHIVRSLDEVKGLDDKLDQGVHLLTGSFEGDRTRGLDNETLSWLNHFCKVNQVPLLIEADGSRGKPIKAPAAHEPAIPPSVEQVAVVLGLSAIGKPLSTAWVHRPEIFSQLSGIYYGDPISVEALLQYLNHSLGGLKNIPPGIRKICVLNQADTKDQVGIARGMTRLLLDSYDSIVISSFNPKDDLEVQVNEGGFQERGNFQVVHAAYEPVAGIVLAAGQSERFGRPKQTLSWQGKPLVWHSAQSALDAGLNPVFVVTGAFHQEVKQAVADLPVKFIHNCNWDQGQGTTVSVGVSELPRSIGAAVFVLADQPHIPKVLIEELVDVHAQTHAPVVVPWVNERHGNPVLFDRVMFPELRLLRGEIGGREIIASLEPVKVPWEDPRILLDVDTPEDYNTLLQLD